MADEISVIIGAENKELNKVLKESGKNLEKFNDKVDSTGDGLGKTNKKSIATASSIRQLTSALKSGDASLSSVAESVLDVGSALSDTQKNTNSAQKATQGLSSVMSGALAAALLTAAVAATKYLFRLSDAAKETQLLIDATKKLIGSAKSEITTYTALLNIARDNTKSIEERRRALIKVNEKSGKYIGNLTLETINTDKITKATKAYSIALLRQAKIKGLQARLSDLYAKQYDLESKSLELNSNILDKLAVATLFALGVDKKAGAVALATSNARAKNAKATSRVTDEIDRLKSSISGLIGEDVSLEGIFSSSKKGDAAKVIRDQVTAITTELVAAKAVIKPIANELGQDLSIVPSPAKMTADELRMMQHLLNINNQLAEFEEAASQIITNGIGSTFGKLGETIGSALATGGDVLKAAGAGLLAGLGQILVDLGKMAIKVGVGIIAVKLSLKSLNPALAIAGGIALVALGSAFAKGASSLADSGGGSGSSSVAGGGSGGSSFSTSTSTSGSAGAGGRYVFEIQGTKLVGVLSNTLARNRALAGSLNLATG